MKNLTNIRARVERLAAETRRREGLDVSAPDPNDPQAVILYALRFHTLPELITASYAPQPEAV